TAPISAKDFSSVWAEDRARDAVRVNELGDLVAGFCIPHSRCVVPRSRQDARPVETESCGLDDTRFVEIGSAMLKWFANTSPSVGIPNVSKTIVASRYEFSAVRAEAHAINRTGMLQWLVQDSSSGRNVPNLGGSIVAPGYEPCTVGTKIHFITDRATVIDPKQRESICITAAE